jgi:ABC-type bacteriocin/lantibiotic exporter with double-glycine peptidase domain
MEVGLGYPVGIGGARLSAAQRQKLSIARSVLKRPDILVIDEATAGLDDAAQARIMRNLFAEFGGRTLIWLVHRASLGKEFNRVLVMEGGKVVEQGSFEELDQPGTIFQELALAN